MTSAVTTPALVSFLLAALSLALQDRRITWRQFAWWATNAIAVGMFLVGKFL